MVLQKSKILLTNDIFFPKSYGWKGVQLLKTMLGGRTYIILKCPRLLAYPLLDVSCVLAEVVA